MKTFSTGSQVIEAFGKPLTGIRKTKVRIRPACGTETFTHKWGDLTAVEGIDYVLMPENGGVPYPCKIDIFSKTWVEDEVGSGLYRRSEVCRFVPIPKGETVLLKSKEGDETVSHPDFIAIGAEDEVYCYSGDWVSKNLEVMSV